MIRNIMVPVRGDGKGDNVLAHAAVIAKRFDAHIEVTHCRARPEDLLTYTMAIPAFLKEQLIESAGKLAESEEAGLIEELKGLAKNLGLVFSEDPTTKGGTVHWTEEQGKQPDVIKHHGRLADLICVPQPDRAQNVGVNTLKSALFLTGRPVMMCPKADKVSENLGDHVAIAWNGSLEASRAVRMTTDILQEASKVTILSAGSGEPHGATADDLKAYLASRSISADINKFNVRDNAGASILSKCGEIGADLLIMGAYGDSHEREVMFGGNTQTVVDTAKMPVILVH
ncbi:MAG: universal stress protein [Tepidamorphaceae bacterium]|nr:universal stress protein [Rhodobiaceae bacterium]MCC0048572.1 universal stress protein [Rhodobiaceae bacterium]